MNNKKDAVTHDCYASIRSVPFFQGKKGIGPVVATALLLVVAVVAIVGFNTWFVDYSSKTFVNVETKDTSDENLEIKTISGTTLYIKNNVEDNLSIDFLEIGDNECTITKNLSLGMNQINVSHCLDNTSNGVQDVVLMTEMKVLEKDIFLKEVSITALPVPPTCINITEGLVALWNMDQTGETVTDSSGNGYNKAVTGTTFVNGPTCSFEDGCRDFDGNDYINLGNLPEFRLEDTTTISLWAKTNSTAATKVLIGNYVHGAGSSFTGYNFKIHSDSYLYIWLRNGAGNYVGYYINGVNLAGDIWHHIVLDYPADGSVPKIYIDGVIRSLTNYQSLTGNPLIGLSNSNDDISIGRCQENSGDYSYFDGTINDFAFYNRSLNSTEIQQIYDYGLNDKPICAP